MQIEPVATALLAHILSTSEQARSVMCELASSIHPDGTFADLDFSDQAAVNDGEGRPDIVGSTAKGFALVLEAKFDAGLTRAQSTGGYLDGLVENGLLLFVVPRDRLLFIWPEILAGPARLPRGDINPPEDAQQPTNPWVSHRLQGGRVIAVTSWEELLGRLLSEPLESTAVADMAQLTDLVQSQVASEWVPVAAGDLTPRTGRQLTRLRDVVRQSATEASGGKSANGTNDFGAARWILDDNGN